MSAKTVVIETVLNGIMADHDALTSHPLDRMACATCTPTPAARCPFEYDHDTFTDTMVEHYVIAALWSECDDDGQGLDGRFTAFDIDPQAMAAIRADCERFYRSNRAMLTVIDAQPEQTGHDFYLTRNGSGTGFWDRGNGAPGDALTTAAETFGESSLYVGDSGRLYVV